MLAFLCTPSISGALDRQNDSETELVDETSDDLAAVNSASQVVSLNSQQVVVKRGFDTISRKTRPYMFIPEGQNDSDSISWVMLALNEKEKPQVADISTEDKSSKEKDIEDAEEIDQETVADPLESVNRVMFDFNDKVYFGVMKPFYGAYNSVLPEEARVAGRNFFDNIAMPVRFVSCLIQIRPQCAGVELARFGINTTVGLAGLFDIASGDPFMLKPQVADIGLAMGHYGIGEGFYIVLPFMGPTSLRDGIGMVGDSFLTPTSYLEPFYVPMAISAVNFVNRGSLQYTEYEDLKKAAIDPYVALKDAYIQYRRGKIK
jgi:phospholipid-binding lipoprotein MlaA